MKTAVKENLEKSLELVGMHVEMLVQQEEEKSAKEKTKSRSKQTEKFASEFSKMDDKLKGKGEIEEKTIRVYKDLKNSAQLSMFNEE